jgi:RNA polymerase sigma factor (sigma-70 family)
MGSVMRAMVIDSTARDITDSVLLSRCLDGDDAAWHALIGRYGRLVEAVIRRYHLPADDHADVFQDVWVALWRDLASMRNHERLGPWLVTAAGRIAWDARKRLARDAKIASVDLDPDLNTVLDDATLPEQEFIRRETSERVRAALARISPRSRRLLEALFFDDDVSYAEVAAQLGYAPNSIGPIRQRCFKELRDALAIR